MICHRLIQLSVQFFGGRSLALVFFHLFSVQVFSQTNVYSEPLWSQMQSAVLGKQPNLKKVEELLKAGFDVNAPIGCGTFNALDGAVLKQNLEMVQLLLAHGAKPKGNALISACSIPNQNVEIVKALLDAGANVNYRDYYDKSNPKHFTTAIHQAAVTGNEKLVRLLLSQKNILINESDSYGKTPLMIAVQNGHSDVVNMLIKAGADPNFKNDKGQTATSFAEKEIKNFREIIAQLEQVSLKNK